MACSTCEPVPRDRHSPRAEPVLPSLVGLISTLRHSFRSMSRVLILPCSLARFCSAPSSRPLTPPFVPHSAFHTRVLSDRVAFRIPHSVTPRFCDSPVLRFPSRLSAPGAPFSVSPLLRFAFRLLPSASRPPPSAPTPLAPLHASAQRSMLGTPFLRFAATPPASLPAPFRTQPSECVARAAALSISRCGDFSLSARRASRVGRKTRIHTLALNPIRSAMRPDTPTARPPAPKDRPSVSPDAIPMWWRRSSYARTTLTELEARRAIPAIARRSQRIGPWSVSAATIKGG